MDESQALMSVSSSATPSVQMSLHPSSASPRALSSSSSSTSFLQSPRRSVTRAAGLDSLAYPQYELYAPYGRSASVPRQYWHGNATSSPRDQLYTSRSHQSLGNGYTFNAFESAPYGVQQQMPPHLMQEMFQQWLAQQQGAPPRRSDSLANLSASDVPFMSPFTSPRTGFAGTTRAAGTPNTYRIMSPRDQAAFDADLMQQDLGIYGNAFLGGLSGRKLSSPPLRRRGDDDDDSPRKRKSRKRGGASRRKRSTSSSGGKRKGGRKRRKSVDDDDDDMRPRRRKGKAGARGKPGRRKPEDDEDDDDDMPRKRKVRPRRRSRLDNDDDEGSDDDKPTKRRGASQKRKVRKKRADDDDDEDGDDDAGGRKGRGRGRGSKGKVGKKGRSRESSASTRKGKGRGRGKGKDTDDKKRRRKSRA